MSVFSVLFPFSSLDSSWMIGGWIVVLVLLLITGSFLNLTGMAGNWIMVGAMGVHYLLVDTVSRVGIGLGLLILLLLLALFGELLEFIAGLLGAGKAGGSKRAMLLSMLGSIAGSIFGMGAGSAVFPILGTLIGIILGGGIGALLGAMLGESWKGSGKEKQFEVGKSAFWGRIIGTLAKSMVGTLILIFSLSALFL